MQAAFGKLARFKTELAVAVKQCAAQAGAAEEVEPLDRAPLEGGEGDGWLLVTRPTQLAAVDGHLRLRQNLDKSTLPGFAQLNPGGRNSFYVLYKFHGKYYELEGVYACPVAFAVCNVPCAALFLVQISHLSQTTGRRGYSDWSQSWYQQSRRRSDTVRRGVQLIA